MLAFLHEPVLHVHFEKFGSAVGVGATFLFKHSTLSVYTEER